MCEHIWLHKCKIPNGGACPWCDRCKLCEIKPINAVEDKGNE